MKTPTKMIDTGRKDFRGQPIKLPKRLIDAMDLKHSHEGKGMPPCWLFWEYDEASSLKGYADAPALVAVCDSRNSAEYHVYAYLQTRPEGGGWKLYVDRVPMNHNFGTGFISELSDKNARLFAKRVVAEREYKYKHGGD